MALAQVSWVKHKFRELRTDFIVLAQIFLALVISHCLGTGIMALVYVSWPSWLGTSFMALAQVSWPSYRFHGLRTGLMVLAQASWPWHEFPGLNLSHGISTGIMALLKFFRTDLLASHGLGACIRDLSAVSWPWHKGSHPHFLNNHWPRTTNPPAWLPRLPVAPRLPISVLCRHYGCLERETRPVVLAWFMGRKAPALSFHNPHSGSKPQ